MLLYQILLRITVLDFMHKKTSKSKFLDLLVHLKYSNLDYFSVKKKLSLYLTATTAAIMAFIVSPGRNTKF